MNNNSSGQEPEPEKKQHRLIKKTRAGVVLSENEVQEIKARRKQLRKELKARGIKDKETFELIAGAEGAYFDKHRGGILPWLLHGRALWALLGAALALLLALFLMSLVSQMRGYFTINMSDGMFKDGFVLSETPGFEQPSINLNCEPAEDVPCISISSIDEDVDEIDGQHNSTYFAYTFYVRNEGEHTVDYTWDMDLIDEAMDLSTATWVMIFEDDQMKFYAKPNSDTGEQEALPPFGDNSRGYLHLPLQNYVANPQDQYQVVAQKGNLTYYRVIPYSYLSDKKIASGLQEQVAPMEVHKYCVVIWLEGDDPDCTDELRDGHLGMAMQFKLLEEEQQESDGYSGSWWQSLLKFIKRE